MAAISDLAIEAIAQDSVRCRWTDNGEVNTLKRAPYGGSYSNLATVTGLTTYTDTTAAEATRYQYKITSGVSGDSNIDDVVTHTCGTDPNEPEDLTLPAFQGDEQQDDLLNQMARDLEAFINTRVGSTDPCGICVANGAVVIDCAKCSDFDVAVTEDINSISMVNCDGAGEGTIKFWVPPSTTRDVCGWPQTFGLEGNECFTTTLGGGSSGAGKSFNVGYTRTGNGPQARGPIRGNPTTGAGGGAGGGGACTCTPDTPGELTLACCTTNCSMDCDDTKSIELVVCGGLPPYTWSVTGGLTLAVSGGNTRATITPPANSGSGVAGTAYMVLHAGGTDCSVQGGRNYKRSYVGCDDVEDSCSAVSWSAPCCEGPCNNLSGTGACPDTGAGNTCGSYTCILPTPNPCNPNGGTAMNCTAAADDCAVGGGSVCDKRDAGMIAAGCNPCGVATDGKVVTVTDAIGVSVSKTLTV